jgi:hypothetical protein
MVFLKDVRPKVYIKMVRCMVFIENVRFVVYIQIEQYHGKNLSCPARNPFEASMTLGRSYGAIDGGIK